MKPLGVIRYLSLRDVERLLPPIPEQIDLAAAAFAALASGDVEMPAKIGVHPRFEAFLHAMPAWFRGEDLVGIKWVAGYPSNPASGRVGVTGLMVLNDPESGYPRCILDGTLITLVRTAAVSGVTLRLFGSQDVRRIGMVGCGAQARSHLLVFLSLLPDVELTAYDRSTERATEFVEWARGLDGVAVATVADTVPSVVKGADVLFTSVSSRGKGEELIAPDQIGAGSLVLPIDWADAVTGGVARAAAHFVVDDRPQFEYARSLDDGYNFPHYPDPDESLGEALLRGSLTEHRPEGFVLVNNLGIGAVDLMFAKEVLKSAENQNVGTMLEW